MVSSALWLIGLALESLLLVRAVHSSLLNRYKLFYLYLGWVLLGDLLTVPIYYFRPEFYPYVYWCEEFCSVLLGCGVVLEIYRAALSHYPGAAHMARNVILFLFVFSISRVLVKAWNSPKWIPGATTLETERDLRTVQTAVLTGLLALLAYYAIPIGRNLRGIVAGYSFFLGMNLIHLSARDSLGGQFQWIWDYLQPISYVVVLLVWVATLWSYAPSSQPEGGTHLERDYQSLLSATRRQVTDMWQHMSRSTRS